MFLVDRKVDVVAMVDVMDLKRKKFLIFSRAENKICHLDSSAKSEKFSPTSLAYVNFSLALNHL